MSLKSRISRSAWPWGRSSPDRRIRDLKVLIGKNLAQIPIIRDQAEEAIRRIELNVKALQEQIEQAEHFLEEQVRAENKKIAYDLALLGINLIEDVSKSDDQLAMNARLKETLEDARNGKMKATDEEDPLDSFFVDSNGVS
jgi:hypothetical protein